MHQKTHHSPSGISCGLAFTKNDYIDHISNISKQIQDETQAIGFNSDAENMIHRSSCASWIIASENFQQKQTFDNSIHSDPISNLEDFDFSFWSYQHLVQNNNSGVTAMTIMAILDSYHDIGHKASRFLLPALKVLIEQFQKNQEKEFKENKMKIPKRIQVLFINS
ncbi:hypothetical protein O181_079947 [Austropuccinia psidii MF-1]|uniref:Uncharacterized protein n=1 Tax=Austropuccinia psidii MF-1 TaxID=1389203 RepID=A0A9Q3FKQ2_9BASI|nr:hypothetical protein [Austropuccinia psidii MF-1]